MKINNDIELEKDKIIKSGKRLAGKGSKVISKVLEKYDVSGCKVLMDSNKDHQILVIKYQRFLKRVKSGEVEKSISKYITKNYYPLYVDHSRSYVKSESFYVCDDGQKLIKLSFHCLCC